MNRDSKGRFCKAIEKETEEKVYATGVKGFLKGMICAPDSKHKKQYKENTVFEEAGGKICGSGVMHAAEDAASVLEHFDLLDKDANFNEFASVKALAPVQKEGTKWATTKLFVGEKYSFVEFINAFIKGVSNKVTGASNNSDDAQIGSSGYRARIGSSGYRARIGSSGDWAQIGSSGYGAQIGSSGYRARIGSSGNCARIGSSGEYARIGSSGDCAKIGSSGDCAKIGSSGKYAQIGSSGNRAQIGSSGKYAKIGSSGDCAKIGSSGNDARIGSSGYRAQIGSSGDCAVVNSTGKKAVISAIGNGSKAKGRKGSWITLAEYDMDNTPILVLSKQIDGVAIKEDTFYVLKRGEFVEAN